MFRQNAYAAQIPIVGEPGQNQIFECSVLQIGTGRLGATTALMLAATGFLRLAAVDPQPVAWDNLNSIVHSSEAHIGEMKVDILRQAISREGLDFHAYPAACEDDSISHLYESADLYICAANKPSARRFVAAKAIEHKKPLLSPGVSEFGGTICIWLPENREWSACPACLLGTDLDEGEPAEGLLFSTVTVIAAWTVQLAVQLATGNHDVLKFNNLISIDTLSNETPVTYMSVQRLSDCAVCGTREGL